MATSRDSVRDSVSSATSRFSSLLTSSTSALSSPTSSTPPPTATNPNLPSAQSQPTRNSFSGSTSTYPIPLPSPSLPPLPPNSKRTSLIYDRPLVKSRGTEVSIGAWYYLFSEMVQYTQKRVSGIGEFEKRLNILGYRVGYRLLELLPLRDYLFPLSSLRSPPPPTRTLRLLPILTYIHSTLYRYLFSRTADSLEKSTENEDEYMIGDDDMILVRNVNVPKEMKELSCAALVAGIVEAVLDGSGFPSRVTAHSVPTTAHPRRTVILIKLDPDVLARESAMK